MLVFFVQVFVSVTLSLFAIVGALYALKKRDRSVPLPFDELEIYWSGWFLAMSLSAITVTAIAAIALLKTSNWHHVVYVRSGLCAVAVLAILKFLYHLSIANSLELIFPFVFLPYFFVSKRVRRAFPQPQPLGAGISQ